jgi:hypothetical protein
MVGACLLVTTIGAVVPNIIVDGCGMPADDNKRCSGYKRCIRWLDGVGFRSILDCSRSVSLRQCHAY